MRTILNELVFLLMAMYNGFLIICGAIDDETFSNIYDNLIGSDFDLEYITKEYLKVCPQLQRCRNGNALFSGNLSEETFINLPVICPECSCEQDCIINDECCPNVIYGYLQYDCISSVKQRGKSFYNETSFYMIATCPQSWSDRNNMTKQNESVLPTTSYTTGLTYRMKEFAECNGDNHSLVMWNTTYHCLERGLDGRPIVINTFEDLVQNVQERNCEIRLSVTNPKVPRQAVCNGELYLKEKIYFKQKEIVDKCNITGFWKKFDPHIEFACRRLSLTYGNYKNVLCYICNPGLSIQYHLHIPKIGTCDSSYIGSNTESACIAGDENMYYLPYKNVFCLLCNRVHPFTFASVGLQETWVLVKNIDENIVAKTIGRLFRSENSCKIISNDEELYHNIFLHEMIRFYESNYSCNIPLHIQSNYNRERNGEIPDCNNRNTTQKMANVLKTHLYNCSDLIENYQIANGNAIIGNIDEKEELVFKYLLHTYLCEDSVKSNNVCESYSSNKTSPYTSSEETERSLSCLICKTGDVYSLSYFRRTGFDFLIRTVCPTLLQAGLFLDTFSLLEVILDNDCSMWFYPTGIIDSGFYNILERTNDCIDFPWIDEITCMNFASSNFYFGSYRMLFSVSNTDWTALLEMTKRQRSSDLTECPEHDDSLTINANDSCREIFCSEGHVLVNNTCKNQFEMYGNILYELDFSLVVTKIEKRTVLVKDANSNQAIALHLAVINIKNVCNNVQNIIQNKMNKNTSYSFKECIIKTDTICSANSIAELVIGSNIEIGIKIIVHFTKELSLVEETLIETLTNAPGTYFVSNSGVKLTYLYQKRAMRTQFCFRLIYDSDNMFISKKIYVSKLLTCPQIQLLENEYQIDNESNTLHLLKTQKQIGIYNKEEGHVRVCLEDFNAKSKSVLLISSLQRLYKVFDNVCTILSLLFMFLTFVTYLIFPSLRTVPGLNNMSLIFSLFFAQTTLKFGIWQPTDTAFCPVFGILIHFFWLATFCSMNVCSFHMYRVFSSKILSVFTRKTSVIYILYTYLIPASTILTTICVHLIISAGQEIGYGKTICFLTDSISIIVLFICPCVFIFLLNILFFSKTFLSMRSTLNNPRLRRSSDRRDVFIYLRLSTLLGIAWPLLIVDAFFQMSVFSFFALIFNTLQGLFVFISFVCNRRVLQLYRTCVFGNAPISTLVQSKISANDDVNYAT